VPKLKPEELETRRQEIIEAARICFLRNGFHKTTTDEICREASITPGGLYHYFGGKEEIISAVIAGSSRQVVDRLKGLLDESGDFASAFRELASFFVESMSDPDLDKAARLDIEIWAEALKNQNLAEISREGWSLRRQFMERFIRLGLDEGMYNNPGVVDPKGLSCLLMAILVGLRIGKVVWGEEFDLPGATRSLFLMNSGQLTSQLAIQIQPPVPAAPVR